MPRKTRQETMMSRCFLWITERHTGAYKELAELLGVSTGTYSNYLKDARNNQLYCTQGGTQEQDKEERIARFFSVSGELAKTKALWHLWLKSLGLLYRKLLQEGQAPSPDEGLLQTNESISALLDEGIRLNQPCLRVFQILETVAADDAFSYEHEKLTLFRPFSGRSAMHIKLLYLCGKVLSQVDRDEDAVEAYRLIKPYAPALGQFYPQFLVNYANSLVNALVPDEAEAEIRHFRESVDPDLHPMETRFIDITEARARMLLLQEAPGRPCQKEDDMALADRLIAFGEKAFRQDGPCWGITAWSTGLSLRSFWCDPEAFAALTSSWDEIEEHIMDEIKSQSGHFDPTDLIYTRLDIARAYVAQGCPDEDLPDIQEMLQDTPYQGAKRLYRNIRRFAHIKGQV